MKDVMIILASAVLFGVGAYGFVKEIDLWGWWLVAGLLLASTTKIDI